MIANSRHHAARVWPAALFALLPLAGGCTNNVATSAANGGVVREAGTYHVDSLSADLAIEIRDHIVHYRIVTRDGRVLLQSTDRPSSRHRWFILWDNTGGRLWVYSGDIGTSVWLPNDEGQFERVSLTGKSELINDIPDRFFEAMPESAQKIFRRDQ